MPSPLVKSVIALIPAVWLLGCGAPRPELETKLQGSILTGRVRGGQQPVSGAAVQLYAVSTSGDGTAAAPLLASTVLTDNNGAFSITGGYQCPSANAFVYLVAKGGNPGLPTATDNTALSEMVALGRCGALNAGSFVSVNEVTTVVSVMALSTFMTSYAALGSSASDQYVLASAFDEVSLLVNTASGTTPGLLSLRDIQAPSPRSIP